MSEQSNAERKITSHVVADYGQLSSNRQGWTRNLKLISWNGHPAKFDIRDWSGGKPGKGMTLTRDEIRNLRDILVGLNLEQFPSDVEENEPEAESF